MPIREYDASEYLKTPEDIAEYLNAVMEEMDDDPRLLMIALRNVVKARGGISALARQADLNRVALSRTLSGQRIHGWIRSRKCLQLAASSSGFQLRGLTASGCRRGALMTVCRGVE